MVNSDYRHFSTRPTRYLVNRWTNPMEVPQVYFTRSLMANRELFISPPLPFNPSPHLDPHSYSLQDASKVSSRANDVLSTFLSLLLDSSLNRSTQLWKPTKDVSFIGYRAIKAFGIHWHYSLMLSSLVNSSRFRIVSFVIFLTNFLGSLC